MQPHSRKSERSEAFVSFEVKLVFESCDLQVANAGEHSQVCGEKEEFEKRKAGPLGAECALKEETPGQDDTRVPFWPIPRAGTPRPLIIIAYAQPNSAVLQRILPACYPNA